MEGCVACHVHMFEVLWINDARLDRHSKGFPKTGAPLSEKVGISVLSAGVRIGERTRAAVPISCATAARREVAATLGGSFIVLASEVESRAIAQGLHHLA